MVQWSSILRYEDGKLSLPRLASTKGELRIFEQFVEFALHHPTISILRANEPKLPD